MFEIDDANFGQGANLGLNPVTLLDAGPTTSLRTPLVQNVAKAQQCAKPNSKLSTIEVYDWVYHGLPTLNIIITLYIYIYLSIYLSIYLYIYIQ